MLALFVRLIELGIQTVCGALTDKALHTLPWMKQCIGSTESYLNSAVLVQLFNTGAEAGTWFGFLK